MNPFLVSEIVKVALLEDIGPGDITGFIFRKDIEQNSRAKIVCRQDLVLSGINVVAEVFKQVDDKIAFNPTAQSGDSLTKGTVVAEISGATKSILAAERVALNFLMHLSGIATLSKRYVDLIKGTKARIVDTRKTTPGLRILEKAAVRHGGALNHRFALYDGVLIKDNHIAAIGSITKAVNLAQLTAPHTSKIEVEVETIEGLIEALEARADIVLLDNMDIKTLKEAVKSADEFFKPSIRYVILEASGGMNLDNVKMVAESGVDLISVGALTHSAPAVDLSLDWEIKKF